MGQVKFYKSGNVWVYNEGINSLVDTAVPPGFYRRSVIGTTIAIKSKDSTFGLFTPDYIEVTDIQKSSTPGNNYTSVQDFFIATDSFFAGLSTSLQDSSGKDIDVQNPLPTNGDSVYCKDIDLVNSDIGDFDGDICCLFDDYTNTNVAASVGGGGANPKSFTLVLKRPIASSTVGIGSPDTSISNGKLILIGLAGDVIKIIDFSADDTKRGVLIFQFEQKIFISVQIQFHTDDEVTLGGAGISKTQFVAIDAINGVISADNSTKELLIADDEFIGNSVDTKNYGIIICSVYADVVSATDGLIIEFSTDQINWLWNDTYSIEAERGKTFSVQTQARFLRVRYINGSTGQSMFQLETTLKPVYIKPSSHRIGDPISAEDDAELVKAILTGQNELTGIFENVETFSNALKVTDGLVHKNFINSFFVRDTGVTANVDAAITVGDRAILVDDEAGFVVDDFCQLRENGTTEFTLLKIITIVSTTITFNRPIDNDYTTDADLFVVSKNMAVDGSVTPVSFRLTPPAMGPESKWQITRILISMTHSLPGDDGKFGGGDALPRGVLLRSNRSGIERTATQWFTNGDLKLDMFNVEYSDKAPAGLNGTSARWTFTESGAIIELEGNDGDFAETLVQDAVDASNTTFEIKAQGRIFGN